MSELEQQLAAERDHSDNLRRLLTELREGLQAIYAMRGEDKFISDTCNPLIEKSRGY